MDDLKEKLTQARLAMEADRHREKRVERTEAIEKKRLEARLAMEGPDRKKKREQKEAEEKEKQAIRQKIAEDVKKRRTEEEQKRTFELEEKKRLEEEEDRLKQGKTARFEESQKTIEELRKNTEASLKAVRTLHTDSSRAIEENQLSASKIALAESEKRSLHVILSDEPEPKTGRFIIILLACLLLILGGAGVFYWVLILKDKGAEVSVATPVESIVFSDENIKIDVAGKQKPEILDAITAGRQRPAKDGALVNLYFTESYAAGAEKREAVLGYADLAGKIDFAAPDYVKRFIEKDFMLGYAIGGTGSTPFLILKVKTYENMAAAILNHETDFVRKIFPSIFGEPEQTILYNIPFQDKTIKNADTRILADAEGKTVLLYSFLDRGTLVFTESEEAFERIRSAYNTPRPKIGN